MSNVAMLQSLTPNDPCLPRQQCEHSAVICRSATKLSPANRSNWMSSWVIQLHHVAFKLGCVKAVKVRVIFSNESGITLNFGSFPNRLCGKGNWSSFDSINILMYIIHKLFYWVICSINYVLEQITTPLIAMVKILGWVKTKNLCLYLIIYTDNIWLSTAGS